MQFRRGSLCWIATAIAVASATLIAGCDDDEPTTTLIVENDGASSVTVSLGASAWRKTIAAGDAGTFEAPGAIKTLWLSGGTADTGLTLTLSHSTHQPVAVLVTRGGLATEDPDTFKAKFLDFFGHFAGKETLETAAAGGLPTAWAATWTIDPHQLTVTNDTPRSIRVQTIGGGEPISSGDFAPGQHSTLPYVLLVGRPVERIDVSDPGVDRGYRIFFTEPLNESMEVGLPSDALPTPTVVPLDPRLCTLSPLGCGKTPKASPTPQQ